MTDLKSKGIRFLHATPAANEWGRYAAFLAHVGRKDEAREVIAEMDKRIKRAKGQFRAEARAWRDHAAQALS